MITNVQQKINPLTAGNITVFRLWLSESGEHVTQGSMGRKVPPHGDPGL